MDVDPATSTTSTETIRRSPEVKDMWKFYVYGVLTAMPFQKPASK
jgi:hypothetical protein